MPNSIFFYQSKPTAILGKGSITIIFLRNLQKFFRTAAFDNA